MSCENNKGKLYNYCLNVRKDQFKLGQVPFNIGMLPGAVLNDTVENYIPTILHPFTVS